MPARALAREATAWDKNEKQERIDHTGLEEKQTRNATAAECDVAIPSFEPGAEARANLAGSNRSEEKCSAAGRSGESWKDNSEMKKDADHPRTV